MSVDPHFERAVIAELVLRERQARRRALRVDPPAEIAHRLHRGHDELIGHLRRVASFVPEAFRTVAWLHHARDGHITAADIAAAGLTYDELHAIDLLAHTDPLHRKQLSFDQVRTIAGSSGHAAHLARVVGRAALTDLQAHNTGSCEHLVAALGILSPPSAWR